jgi:hypothetical protein
VDDFLSAADVFPGVGLKGGVCYFTWDRDNRGDCRVSTHFKDWPDSVATRPLLEQGADIFIRFNEGLSILKKVMAVETGQSESLALPAMPPTSVGAAGQMATWTRFRQGRSHRTRGERTWR